MILLKLASTFSDTAVAGASKYLEFGQGLLAPVAVGLRPGGQIAPAHLQFAQVPGCPRAIAALGEG